MKQSEQRDRWLALKKDIQFQISNVNNQNVKQTAQSLISNHNLVRAQGILVKEIMKRYTRTSLKDSNVFNSLACLAAIINSELLSIGELLCCRVVLQFTKSYMKNDYSTVEKNITFTCALVNQRVIHEMAVLHLLRLLMSDADTNILKMQLVSIILTINGKLLDETSKLAMGIVYDKLRDMLYNSRSRQMSDIIERLIRIKQSKFKQYPILNSEFDVISEDDRITHAIDLTGKEDDDSSEEEGEEDNDEKDNTLKLKDELNFFRFDPNYEINEEKYFQHIQELNHDTETKLTDSKEEEHQDNNNNIVDMTNAQILEHQKTVYLTMMSSMSSDEAVHKLLRLRGILNTVLVDMIIRSCAQERDFTKYVGDIGDKLLGVDGKWRHIFRDKFDEFYANGDKFEASGIRNIGKFYGHLLSTDKLSVDDVFENVTLDEEHTDSAKRVMIKFIFQQMVTEIGISGVKDRFIHDIEVKEQIRGILPVVNVDWRDADQIRFLINFFTAIGLGQLTDEMRHMLNNLLPPSSEEMEEQESRGRRNSRGSAYDSDRSFSRSRSRSQQSYSRTPSRERPSSRSPSPSSSRMHFNRFGSKS
ncbi:pre-mRNA-splicing factor cwc22 [Scheffersomyces spartinae]|uniref:Pre-mRNA-splicing factor CWC22 n=1 Tax=Scheffersomyces spartinae TaxID=45513 RepID=A0A9P7VCY3_9ASCO|nr:pre-mRNA-splicing factor cwc22 [Scheffersomyces spartinae]KAG7195024.1 pre-mRNA-splicing factor cwc22 [Scheffersomyces spartinae]